MNRTAIGHMVRLRYQLMWARTRSGSGRIALFAVGCLLLSMLAIVLGTGGIGAGIVAIRAGDTELFVQAVLSGLYLEALCGSVLTGFGLNTVFTGGQLRRYPISPWERRMVRHGIALADPFWLLVLALELGLACSLCLLGESTPLRVFPALLILFVSNYLLARVVSLAIDTPVASLDPAVWRSRLHDRVRRRGRPWIQSVGWLAARSGGLVDTHGKTAAARRRTPRRRHPMGQRL